MEKRNDFPRMHHFCWGDFSWFKSKYICRGVSWEEIVGRVVWIEYLLPKSAVFFVTIPDAKGATMSVSKKA